MSDSPTTSISFPHYDLRPNSVTRAALSFTMIEVATKPDGSKVLTILRDGRQEFQEALPIEAAGHLARLLLSPQASA